MPDYYIIAILLMDIYRLKIYDFDTEPVSIVFQITLDGCGSEKGCFCVPANCSLTEKVATCEMVATWKVDEENMSYQLVGRTEGYVEFGLSNDNKIVGYYVAFVS